MRPHSDRTVDSRDEFRGLHEVQADSECQRFEIQVADAETGRGIPLAEFKLAVASRNVSDLASKPVHEDPAGDDGDVAYAVTDSAGRVALNLEGLGLNQPELTSDRVEYYLESHGYESTSGTFTVEPGGETSIELTPKNIAKRLYRKTGQGIYRDTVLLGYDPPIENPLLNAQVVGLDTVLSQVYDGEIYWFYGDTDKLSYPLGNFQTTGATSTLPEDGGLDPAVGVNQDYFEDDSGFVKPMVPRPDHASNSDLFWVSRLVTVPDDSGEERLVASYSRLAGLDDLKGRGLVVFNDAEEQFDLLKTGWELDYHTGAGDLGTLYEDPDGGGEYWFFTTPWPWARVPNDFESVQQTDAYEYFTPLEPGTAVRDGSDERIEDTSIERDADGNAVWDWKAGTEPVTQRQERSLINADLLDPDQARLQVTDVDSGDSISMHWGSVNWNDHRQKWIMIFQEEVGASTLGGEIWYAEADSPTGPWTVAKRIVTHDDYTFYNPNHHEYLDQEGGRYVYFEGTYTDQFSGAEWPTPLYDYNQVIYRLDLDHPDLDLPLSS